MGKNFPEEFFFFRFRRAASVSSHRGQKTRPGFRFSFLRFF